MRVLSRVLLLSSLLCIGRVELEAQSPEDEVRAVIARLFDAMRTADGATAARLFHPDARLQSASLQAGQPMLRTDPATGFVQAIGTPRTEVWDERIWDLEVRVDAELATAWMQYAFHVDGVLSHCGVNAFQLFRGTAGWQIIQVTDTRRREGCASGP